MKSLACSVVLLMSMVTICLADAYVAMTGFGGLETQTWTSDGKRREEGGLGGAMAGMVNALMPGMSKQIVIYRLDKGVEWTLFPDKKVYTEKPIALPYQPIPKSDKKVGDDNDVDDGKGEKFSIRKKGTKTIAGLSATGYEFLSNDEPQSILWTVPLEGDVAKVAKEDEKFQKALLEKRYSEWPAEQRKEMIGGFSALGAMMKGGMDFLKGVTTAPEGYPMAMEGVATKTNPEAGMMLFQVTKISAESCPPAFFEIPLGYKKMDEDQMQNQAVKDMLKGSGIDMKQLEQMARELESIQKK